MLELLNKWLAVYRIDTSCFAEPSKLKEEFQDAMEDFDAMRTDEK